EMEELQLERQLLASPQGRLRAEADTGVAVPIEVGDPFRQWGEIAVERLFRQLAGPLHDPGKLELPVGALWLLGGEIRTGQTASEEASCNRADRAHRHVSARQHPGNASPLAHWKNRSSETLGNAGITPPTAASSRPANRPTHILPGGSDRCPTTPAGHDDEEVGKHQRSVNEETAAERPPMIYLLASDPGDDVPRGINSLARALPRSRRPTDRLPEASPPLTMQPKSAAENATRPRRMP